jgi:hypothetical protein
MTNTDMSKFIQGYNNALSGTSSIPGSTSSYNQETNTWSFTVAVPGSTTTPPETKTVNVSNMSNDDMTKFVKGYKNAASTVGSIPGSSVTCSDEGEWTINVPKIGSTTTPPETFAVNAADIEPESFVRDYNHAKKINQETGLETTYNNETGFGFYVPEINRTVSLSEIGDQEIDVRDFIDNYKLAKQKAEEYGDKGLTIDYNGGWEFSIGTGDDKKTFSVNAISAANLGYDAAKGFYFGNIPTGKGDETTKIYLSDLHEKDGKLYIAGMDGKETRTGYTGIDQFINAWQAGYGDAKDLKNIAGGENASFYFNGTSFIVYDGRNNHRVDEEYIGTYQLRMAITEEYAAQGMTIPLSYNFNSGGHWRIKDGDNPARWIDTIYRREISQQGLTARDFVEMQNYIKDLKAQGYDVHYTDGSGVYTVRANGQTVRLYQALCGSDPAFGGVQEFVDYQYSIYLLRAGGYRPSYDENGRWSTVKANGVVYNIDDILNWNMPGSVDNSIGGKIGRAHV